LRNYLIHTHQKTAGIFFHLLLLTFIGFGQSPVANFSANPQTGCSPLIVLFQDLSTGNPTSWSWDFGNGNTSTLQNPSATYITPGTYTIRLTATNATGSNTLTQTAYITVYENPVVNFTADNTSGCFPFRVQFTDQSTAGSGNTNVSWQWDFGNGATSTLQNPLVTYTTAGTYTVTLTVTNDKGCRKVFVRPNYITITSGVIAGFINTTSTVCRPPVSISFTDTSTGPGILSYQWDFGDGNTSSVTNPVNIYNTAGSYIVTLITTSSAGCVDTFRSPVPIVIGGIATSFTAPASTCTNETITLTNTSSPLPVSTLWNFGDGNTATTLNAKHAYTTAGVYTIRLYNTYSTCQDSAQQTITINPQPVADFSSPDTIRCEPSLTSNFTDLSTGGVTAWQWDFGDGGTSTLQNPSHTYTAYGLYTVTLITTNGFGCKDTVTKTNYVKIQRAQISIPSLPARGCVPYTLMPVANVTALDNITSWFWDFGYGNTSNLKIFLPLDDIDRGNVASDVSGDGLNGTLSGGSSADLPKGGGPRPGCSWAAEGPGNRRERRGGAQTRVLGKLELTAVAALRTLDQKQRVLLRVLGSDRDVAPAVGEIAAEDPAHELRGAVAFARDARLRAHLEAVEAAVLKTVVGDDGGRRGVLDRPQGGLAGGGLAGGVAFVLENAAEGEAEVALIVDHEDFEVGQRLRKGAPEAGADAVAAIEGRNHHAHDGRQLAGIR